MARRAKTTKTAKPAMRGRKTGHPATSVKRPTKKAARTAKGAVSTASPKRTPPIAPVAPKLNKDELRAQVDKLERANANLRAKNREGNREAKTTAARIGELEEQVARLEKLFAAHAAEAGGDRAAPAPKLRRTRHREIDPGDSVPPGVAVEEPAPLDLEAEITLANLEEHLGGDVPLVVEAETVRDTMEERLGGEAPSDLDVATGRENLGEQLGGE
jgi:hypothetical protein